MADRLLRRLAHLNTKDCLWMYILRILSEEPAHAYGLRKEIEKRFGFKPGTVTAYRVLYHLTANGFVSKKSEGRRKIYSITGDGRKELKKAIAFYRKRIEMLG
jgi:DNA-binding PadR family transcriptional regulator